MGHIQSFGEQLREKLRAGIDEEELITWAKDQVLQSYRNGLALNRAAGEKGRAVGAQAARNARPAPKP